jgi:gamma-glutamylcyclotransferase (GGCT)/AIG2-like uncharacterized protein YtfP
MACACAALETDLLFVYGTLRSDVGHPMHWELRRLAAFEGPARLPARLYDLGAYPGIVAPRLPGDVVTGEVYRLREPAAALERLDRYEGCTSVDAEPHEFGRAVAQVRLLRGGAASAWVYWYLGRPAHARLLSHGDYARALRERRPGANL